MKCSTTTYAQVCNVLSHKTLLDRLLEDPTVKSHLQVTNTIHNLGLLYVLLYELLLGPNKAIKGGGALKRKLVQSETLLRHRLSSLQTNNPEDTIATVTFPRYVRINTLKTTLKDVVSILMQSPSTNDKDRCFNFSGKVFRDPHVPDLLVLPPNATKPLLSRLPSPEKAKLTPDETTNDDTTLTSAIVLQDKSSCFPALCLVRGFDDDSSSARDYIDACAAPGNKTTHLAALLAQTTTPQVSPQTIYALDRCPSRLKLLQQRVSQLVPSQQFKDTIPKVMPTLQDFLATDPSNYPTVGAILLDPSCSGSGIYTSIDRRSTLETVDDNTDDETQQRLQSLSSFQRKALLHAMSFPSVDRIVYSTCSIHEEENEQVVAHVLHETPGGRDQWQVVAPKCLSDWKRRGLPILNTSTSVSEDNGDGNKIYLTVKEASCLIRADKDDETNGFFVCCLQRKKLSTTKSKSKSRKKGKRPNEDSSGEKGMEIPVYDGQFRSRETVTKDRSLHKKEGPEETKRNTGTETKPIMTKQNKNGPLNDRAAKKARQQISKKRPFETEDDPSPTKTALEEKIAKKRLKKLEWKRKQRQAKLERINQKQKKG